MPLVGDGDLGFEDVGGDDTCVFFSCEHSFDRIQKMLFDQYVIETLSSIKIRHQELDQVVVEIDACEEGATGGRTIDTST